MNINVLIEQNKNNEFYKIIINITIPHGLIRIYALDGIIEYFKLPDNYLIDNLLQFDGFIIKEELLTNNKIHYLSIMYYKMKEDAEKAKQWIENNLDSFLVISKLVGE